MNGRNGPLSPVSLGGSSEWSGIDRYGNDTESQYSPNPISRGQLASPPVSTGSGTMNNGGRLPQRNPGDPSPPASIARSSTGTNNLYNGSDSGRNRRDDQFEAVLSEHYGALRRYLAVSLRDKGNPRPNKAQDKLLRLSAVQFQELSTDVFDELQRRQTSSRKTPNGSPPNTPAFLPPEKNFHPKRNQARQKLSSLPPPRFRDLATDVFYELERRFPTFAGGDISRIGSPASMRGQPIRNGTPGPDGRGSRRRPSDATSVASYGPRSDSRSGGPLNGSSLNVPPSPALPPNDFGRPTPKTFQQNTIVPVKSTMVEDDDDADGVDDEGDDNSDAFGLENAARDRKNSADSGAAASEPDKKLIEDYQSQVTDLRGKLDAMEDRIREKDGELNSVMDGERNRATAVNVEKKAWDDLRMKLENKLADAQALNHDLRQELDRVRAESSNMERDMRSQIEELQESSRELAAQAQELRANGGPTNGAVGGSSNGQSMNDVELERENQLLRRELDEQQEITEEVRKEAQEFLREMRILSESGGASWQRQEKLEAQVNRLEEEVKDWRNRYARTKTQLRSVRASSIGLTIQQDAAKYAKDSRFTEDTGMVKDVHVTKFQISIDELLQVARKDNLDRVTDYMKDVVSNVRRITQDIEEDGNELTPQQTKLRSRVSATANNLITASKNFVAAGGISPVSLLDAAASHLTAAVVELVRTVKIRPTPAGELEDDDDGSLQPSDSTVFFPVGGKSENDRGSENDNVQPFMGMRNAGMSGRMSGESSMYSPFNSPRESAAMGRPKSSSKISWREPSISIRVNGNPNGVNGMNGKKLPAAPMAFGIRQQNGDIEDLKIYLEDQTALLVQNIQGLVGSIRSESNITVLSSQITSIAAVVGKITSATESTIQETGNAELREQATPVLGRLEAVQRRLIQAGEDGMGITEEDQEGEGFRRWAGGLPPIAFEIAREVKEMVQRVDNVDVGLMSTAISGDEDFS